MALYDKKAGAGKYRDILPLHAFGVSKLAIQTSLWFPRLCNKGFPVPYCGNVNIPLNGALSEKE